MKLLQLLEGTVDSEFVLIHDDKDAKGDALLVEFLKCNVKLQSDIHILCLEKSPVLKQYLTLVPTLKYYGFSNLRAWKENGSDKLVEENTSPMKVLQQIQNTLQSKAKRVIIIDSLSLFLLLYPDTCYKTIYRLLNCKSSPGKLQVVCLLHSDVMPGGKKVEVMFEQLATTNLYVSRVNNQSQVITKHRKSSGRIIQTTEQIVINESGLSTKEIKSKENDPEENNTEWMSNDVTFKLQLEEEEKQARSKLVLPYLKTGKQSSGGGEIIYEPDASDDWDDEDPDDDLNI